MSNKDFYVEAGCAIDAMVAEIVMKKVPFGYTKDWSMKLFKEPLSPYSTDRFRAVLAENYSTNMESAWKVVSLINPEYFNLLKNEEGLWEVRMRVWNDVKDEIQEYSAVGHSAAHAICLAALRSADLNPS